MDCHNDYRVINVRIARRLVRQLCSIALVVGVLWLPSVAWACPDCKDSLAGQQGNLPLGFGLSIGLMLVAPMLLCLAWTVGVRRCLKAAAIEANSLRRANLAR